VVHVLLQFQRAVCFLCNVGMGNRSGHFISCVQIVRIPSHQPKKVPSWVSVQSIECQMGVIVQ
jgi:hypothetical protein